MHDLLFEHQDALRMPDLLRYARELGLDVRRFEEDLREGRFSGRVAQDVNSAEEAGVAGTPTFFINEVLYRGAHDAASVEAAIERVLAVAQRRAQLAEGRA